MAQVKFLFYDIIAQERCTIVSRKKSYTDMRVEYEWDGTTAFVNEQDIVPIVRCWFKSAEASSSPRPSSAH